VYVRVRVCAWLCGCVRLCACQEAETALAAALREEVRSAAAAADKFKAQLATSESAVAAVSQRAAAGEERHASLSAAVEAVGRDVAALAEALGGRPAPRNTGPAAADVLGPTTVRGAQGPVTLPARRLQSRLLATCTPLLPVV
jgi:hypothetical protein